MSQRERDRLQVLHQVENGQLKQREAATQLRMSERGFRKLWKRFRAKQDRAVVHGLRGRASQRKLAEPTKQKILKMFQERYADFGPTLAAEYLAKDEAIKISRETLRKLLIAAGLRQAKPRKVKQIHQWRPRRSSRGELLQWDTSVHAWLEDRGPEKMYLVAAIDDATNTLFARFVPADSTEYHMRVLWAYLEKHGRPQAIYTDKASLFQPTLAPGWKQEEPGEKSETQLGRAFRELGIEWIAAHSPQAKGRIERCFGTLQDRLVKALRLAGIASLEAANEFLERTFLPEWNQTMTTPPASEVDGHRPVGKQLELASVLSHRERREVTNDYTIAWQGERWQIPKSAVRPGLRRSSVWIEARLNGALVARIGEQFVELQRCQRSAERLAATVQAPPIAFLGKPPGKKHVPAPGQNRAWMEGFRVERNPARTAGREAAVPPQPRSPSGLPRPGGTGSG